MKLTRRSLALAGLATLMLASSACGTTRSGTVDDARGTHECLTCGPGDTAEPEAESALESESAPEASAAEPDPLAAPRDVTYPPATAERTASGLAHRLLRPGHGTTHPTATSKVTVHYTGWTADGHMFDSSLQRGQPNTFPLDRVIEGWTEGVQLMVEGEKRRFWIPEDLAYQGRPGVPQGMLVFDIELLGFE